MRSEVLVLKLRWIAERVIRRAGNLTTASGVEPLLLANRMASAYSFFANFSTEYRS